MRPHLSWQIQSDRPNVRQTACRIIARDGQDNVQCAGRAPRARPTHANIGRSVGPEMMMTLFASETSSVHRRAVAQTMFPSRLRFASRGQWRCGSLATGRRTHLARCAHEYETARRSQCRVNTGDADFGMWAFAETRWNPALPFAS